MPSKYRSKTEIVAHILQAANGRNDITKTRIMYRTFLTYWQLEEYLAILIQSGLLEYLEARHTYKTTERGLKFLNIYEKMGELMPETRLHQGQEYVN
jgi:predicted transcriptional regulator